MGLHLCSAFNTCYVVELFRAKLIVKSDVQVSAAAQPRSPARAAFLSVFGALTRFAQGTPPRGDSAASPTAAPAPEADSPQAAAAAAATETIRSNAEETDSAHAKGSISAREAHKELLGDRSSRTALSSPDAVPAVVTTATASNPAKATAAEAESVHAAANAAAVGAGGEVFEDKTPGAAPRLPEAAPAASDPAHPTAEKLGHAAGSPSAPKVDRDLSGDGFPRTAPHSLEAAAAAAAAEIADVIRDVIRTPPHQHRPAENLPPAGEDAAEAVFTAAELVAALGGSEISVSGSGLGSRAAGAGSKTGTQSRSDDTGKGYSSIMAL